MDFTHLHLHSTYSFLDGFGTIEQIIAKAKELKFKSLALTDHGSVDGLLPFYFECKKQKINPILGVEFYVYTGEDFKEERKTNHITVLAKNKKGFENLCKLTTIANQQFYYQPRINLKQIVENQEGLIILSGCNASPFFELGFNSDIAKEFENFYFEIVPLDFVEYRKKIEIFISQIRKNGIPIVATGDVHFMNQGDETIQLILKLIKYKQIWYNHQLHKLPDLFLRNEEQMRFGVETYFPFLTKEEVEQSIKNTQEISSQCNINLEEKMSLGFDTGNLNKEDYFLKKVEEGIKIRQVPKTAGYANRLIKETKLIKEKDFIDYFLIVADIVNWAKKNNIFVGAGRGSSAGSLICYLLGITEVNPIKFDLLFERFLEPTRLDPPDIDVDIEDAKRSQVIDYIKEKYGNVAHVSAYSFYKGKNCLLDIARVFNIPREKILKITPLIIERSGADSRASFTLEDTFKEFAQAQELLKEYPVLKFAKQLEGQIRQKTKNAAAIVISNKPLWKVGAILKDGALSMDAETTKTVGILKLDILGLNTLKAVHNAVELIKKRHNKEIDVYNLPLDAEEVYRLFRENRVEGVFQYDGLATKTVLAQFPPDNFNDLVILNALSRPGSLHCGGTTEFIKRRKQNIPKYAHPSLESILKKTLGIFVFQEQVMQCVREKGNFNWEDTHSIRKAMSGSLGEEFFGKYQKKFFEGAKTHNFTEAQMTRTWNELVTFGSWGFNEAHSTSYALLGYWCMWLKANYPLEFYTCLVAGTFSKDKRDRIVKEWKTIGREVLNIDINKSKKYAVIDGDAIRMGFADIEGFGEKTAEEIVGKQPFIDAEDFHKRINRRIVNKTKTAILTKIGALDEAEKIQLSLFQEKKTIIDKKDLRTFCPWMFDLDFSKYREEGMTLLNKLVTAGEGNLVRTVGIIREIDLRDIAIELKKGTSYGRQTEKQDLGKNKLSKFCNIILEDETDRVLVTINRYSYPKLKEEVWKDGGKDNIILVEGTVRPGKNKIYAKKIKVLGKV